MQTKTKILLTLTFLCSLTTPINSDKSRDDVKQITQEEEPVITKLLFINKTQHRIRAIFEPVTACMEQDTIDIKHHDANHEHNDTQPQGNETEVTDTTPKQIVYTLPFGFCLNAEEELQTITLEPIKLATNDIYEGCLDLTTATTCTLSFFDHDTKLKVEYTFSINGDEIYQLDYRGERLIFKRL